MPAINMENIRDVEIATRPTLTAATATAGEVAAPADARDVALTANTEISVEKLAPKTAAGVALAKNVLMMTFTTIVLLCVYLIIMEFSVGSDVKSAYIQVISSNKMGAEIYTLSKVEQMISDMETAGRNATYVPTQSASANSDSVTAFVSRVRSIPASDKAIIAGCKTLPADPTLADKAKTCVEALTRVRDAAVDASGGEGNAAVASDFAAKILEQRQSLHTFWIQAAQLILLNLLLPLLTGLFGYIFGTQQSGVKA